MKYLALIFPLLFALTACSSTDTSQQSYQTPTSVHVNDKRDIDSALEIHRTIHVEISQVSDQPGTYKFNASLIESTGSFGDLTTSTLDDLPGRSSWSRSVMNLPEITIDEGKEALVEIGPISGRVLIDTEKKQLNYEVSFIDERGPLSSSGSISLGANQAR